MVSVKCSVVLTILIQITFAFHDHDEVTKSPCPEIFSYRFDGKTWFGFLKLPNPKADEAQLKIIFSLDNGVENSTVKGISPYGRKRTDGTQQFRVDVSIPPLPLPGIKEIIYENSIICFGPGESSVEINYTVKRYVPEPQGPTSQPSMPLSQDVNEVCGRGEPTLNPFIVDGLDLNTDRTEWPWMVAVYVNSNLGVVFKCGGSLISARAVLTAAQCINTADQKLEPKDVALWFGKYRLSDWLEPGAVSSNVETIHVHPDFQKDPDSFDADLATLIMPNKIQFTHYIRPICLWPPTNSLEDVEGQRGRLAGWGKDGATLLLSNELKKIDLPIVNSLDCVARSVDLVKAVSQRTFCAGSLLGAGPCRGDAGGGLALVRDDRWTLRGIVSAGINDPNVGCKLTEYVVFTDVAKHIDWIKDHI